MEAAARPATQLLEEELDFLKEGMGQLRRRAQDQRQAISATQSAMKATIGGECIKVAGELETAARDLSGQLVAIDAASAALASVAPNNVMSSLRLSLETAKTGLCADNNMLYPRGGDVAVTTMIDPLVNAIRTFDPTLANSVPAHIGLPRDKRF